MSGKSSCPQIEKRKKIIPSNFVFFWVGIGGVFPTGFFLPLSTKKKSCYIFGVV
jgi:hypothetical protein